MQANEGFRMRTRYRVERRMVRFEVDDGSESIRIELSRAGLFGNPGLIARDSRARAIAAGSRRSSSSSIAESGPAGAGKAEATAATSRRYRFRLSE
jgi:hypothetical protein